MDRSIHRGMAFALVTLLGVASSTEPQDAPAWTLSGEPLLSIGGLADDSLYELSRAESAVRLSTGEIVIANRGSFQLRWYDARGRFVRAAGRRGQGPAEFRSLQVYAGTADTLLAVDNSSRRVLRFTPDGAYAGMDSSGAAQREAWLFDRTVVMRLPAGVDKARLRATLLRLPHNANDPVRGALVDRAGNVWVRAPRDSARFTVYDASARLIGQVTVPPRFEIYEPLDTLVLGRYRDEDGVESIQLRRLTRRPPASPPGGRDARPPYDEAEENRALADRIGSARAALRNLLTLQEAYYSGHKRYADKVSELAFPVPDGVSITLIAPTGNTYWIVAELRGTRVTCVVGVGSVIPFGFVEACG